VRPEKSSIAQIHAAGIRNTGRPGANQRRIAIRAGQNRSGRKIVPSCGATAPLRASDEVTRHYAIPENRGKSFAHTRSTTP